MKFSIFTPPCNKCDNCLAGKVIPSIALEISFPLGSRVRHTLLGTGTVMGYEGDTITVLFAESGYQMLDLALVQENGLLQPQ